MLLPNAHRAVVDIRKLRDYCLNPEHDDGKHKARLFSAALGMSATDAEELRLALLAAVKTSPATAGREDAFGSRYRVDFSLEWKGRRAMIRSGWLIEPEMDAPKITTCYPL